MSYFDQVEEAAAFLRGRLGEIPSIAVVLGSGLGAFADRLADASAVPYTAIPHWPASTVVGHAGTLVRGAVGGARRADAGRPGALLRGPRPQDGDLCHARARPPGREDAGADQRGRRHQHILCAGHADGDRRPHQPDGQQPAGRSQRRAFRRALSRHDGRRTRRGCARSPTQRPWPPAWTCDTASTSGCTARATRPRPRSGTCAPLAPMPSGCPRCPKPSWPGTWGSRCSGFPASPTRRPACCPSPLQPRRGDGGRAPRERGVHGPAGGNRCPCLIRSSLPHAPRAGTPWRRTPASRSARRCSRRTAPSSPAATSRTPPTVSRSAPSVSRCSRRWRRVTGASAGSRSWPTRSRRRRPAVPCRQILWEFAGDIEVVLANLRRETGRHRLSDLLPLPFDRRLLR